MKNQFLKRIYFDNAATSFLLKSVLKSLKSTLKYKLGNPSSITLEGRFSRSLIEETRLYISNLFHCSTREILFTSGATESNNLLLNCLFSFYSLKFKKIVLVTTRLEHLSIYNFSQFFKRTQFISFLSSGLLNLKNLEEQLVSILKDEETFIILSIQQINNEIGTIQPIYKISKLLLKLFSQRKRIFFHSDASQSIGKIPFRYLAHHFCDSTTYSGHKFGVPKGISFLFLKKEYRFFQFSLGGEQEFGIRAGTENVLFISLLKIALQEYSKNFDFYFKKVVRLKNFLQKKINVLILRCKNKLEIQEFFLKDTIPHIISLFFLNFTSNYLVKHMDLKGISIGSGSACSSLSSVTSRVLLLLKNKQIADNTIRISFNHLNTKREILVFITLLNDLFLLKGLLKEEFQV